MTNKSNFLFYKIKIKSKFKISKNWIQRKLRYVIVFRLLGNDFFNIIMKKWFLISCQQCIVSKYIKELWNIILKSLIILQLTNIFINCIQVSLFYILILIFYFYLIIYDWRVMNQNTLSWHLVITTYKGAHTHTLVPLWYKENKRPTIIINNYYSIKTFCSSPIESSKACWI